MVYTTSCLMVGKCISTHYMKPHLKIVQQVGAFMILHSYSKSFKDEIEIIQWFCGNNWQHTISMWNSDCQPHKVRPEIIIHT